MRVRNLRKRFLRRLAGSFVLAAIAAGGLYGSNASAQQYLQDRNPSSSNFQPTLSPYLNLLNRRTTVLPNYFEFVRPQQQMINAFNQQNREIQRQQQSLRAVDRRIDSMSRQGGSSPTGIRGGFMDYSHFYPGLGGR